MRHAKIVCTLGPASTGYAKIRELVAAGMDVARLNFSHGDHAVHRQNCLDVRQAAADLGRVVAVLGDLSGPKIRLGDLPNGGVSIPAGGSFTFVKETGVGTATAVSTTYPALADEVKVGDFVYVDDGLLQFEVTKIVTGDVHCRAVNGGVVSSRKGLNIPSGGMSAPAISAKDRADIAFAREIEVDYLAQSFVRSAADIHAARELAGDLPIVAKIEKPQAIDRLFEIADAADGLMVARGDLGVEVGAEKVPLLQKHMIREANLRSKPVIVATQMLESMVTNPRPTRAEVSDVANALLDGADAVMLSAESAKGAYPVESVRTMASIVTEVEGSAIASGAFKRFHPETFGFDDALARAAAETADALGLQAIAVFSASGRSVGYVSASRPQAPIYGFSPNRAVLARMALRWGVTPVAVDRVRDAGKLLRQAESTLGSLGYAKVGDRIAVLLGMDVSEPPGSTMLKLWTMQFGAGGVDYCIV
jgi:pyruvate kinase